jgi:hypothetical protein
MVSFSLKRRAEGGQRPRERDSPGDHEDMRRTGKRGLSYLLIAQDVPGLAVQDFAYLIER